MPGRWAVEAVEPQQGRVPDPFEDASAQAARRRAHFRLHFSLHAKSLIRLV